MKKKYTNFSCHHCNFYYKMAILVSACAPVVSVAAIDEAISRKLVLFISLVLEPSIWKLNQFMDKDWANLNKQKYTSVWA